jgi:hypothetical protein
MLVAALAAALATSAPAAAQSSQNFPAGSIFFEPLTPPSSPRVHIYVPPDPTSAGRSGSGSQRASGDPAGFSGSGMPPATARPVPTPLFGFTTDCNAVAGGTASGRTSATTSLDCVPNPAGSRDTR